MGNKKILIVDGDPDVRLGLHVRLKPSHYDVAFAAASIANVGLKTMFPKVISTVTLFREPFGT